MTPAIFTGRSGDISMNRRENIYLTYRDSEKLASLVREIGNCNILRTFQPYNIIITPEQSAVIIDFANICKAPKEYDIARIYFLLKEAVKEKPIAELYLQKMQVEYREIRTHVDVLDVLRQYEIC